MKRLLPTVVLHCLAIAALTVEAASIGDPAPPLNIERWIKGSPVRITPGSNIFVVEFWATWCPPCRRSIPHLSALQKEYANKGVIFIGISKETAAEVAPFVAGQGDNMAYRVAIDTSGRTYASWMKAYGQNGIPHAFLVNTKGQVVWHDFPAEGLDRALSDLLAGKFDIEYERNRETGERLVRQYTALVTKADAAAKAAPIGEKIMNDYCRDCRIPYELAKAIVSDPDVRSRDLALALRASTKALEMTGHRDAHVLAIHARALFANGKKKEAVETQKKAIELWDDQEDLPELRKFLSLYEKGAAQP